jgi:uncharacterized protein (DUF2461 family)
MWSRNRRLQAELRSQSLSLYRKCIRILQDLDYRHRKVWYDYTRLKYEEHKHLSDPERIKSLITDATEQIQWTKSIILRKIDSKTADANIKKT